MVLSEARCTSSTHNGMGAARVVNPESPMTRRMMEGVDVYRMTGGNVRRSRNRWMEVDRGRIVRVMIVPGGVFEDKRSLYAWYTPNRAGERAGLKANVCNPTSTRRDL